MVGDHKNRSVIFAKPNSSLSLDPRSAASLRSVDGLRDHLVEVAEVVWAPEVRHAPVVVVPEVRGAARAQGAHEVIPLLGPEISEMHTKYNHIYFYKIFKILEKYLNRNLTCPALWTPGDWSPSCCGHPACSCCGCSASTSPSRPCRNMISTIMIKSWASRCPTWWWGRGSPGSACPRRRSCSAPRSSDSRTLQLLTSAQLDWGEPTFYFYLFWLTQNLPSRHNVDIYKDISFPPIKFSGAKRQPNYLSKNFLRFQHLHFSGC